MREDAGGTLVFPSPPREFDPAQHTRASVGAQDSIEQDRQLLLQTLEIRELFRARSGRPTSSWIFSPDGSRTRRPGRERTSDPALRE